MNGLNDFNGTFSLCPQIRSLFVGWKSERPDGEANPREEEESWPERSRLCVVYVTQAPRQLSTRRACGFNHQQLPNLWKREEDAMTHRGIQVKGWKESETLPIFFSFLSYKTLSRYLERGPSSEIDKIDPPPQQQQAAVREIQMKSFLALLISTIQREEKTSPAERFFFFLTWRNKFKKKTRGFDNEILTSLSGRPSPPTHTQEEDRRITDGGISN